MTTLRLRPVCPGCGRPMAMAEARGPVRPDGRIKASWGCPDPGCLYFDFGGSIDPDAKGWVWTADKR